MEGKAIPRQAPPQIGPLHGDDGLVEAHVGRIKLRPADIRGFHRVAVVHFHPQARMAEGADDPIQAGKAIQHFRAGSAAPDEYDRYFAA